MSELVPEKRVDKRGHTSTKWVKPSGVPSNAATHLPSAGALSKTARTALVRKLANVIGRSVHQDSNDKEPVRDELLRYSDSSLHILRESIEKDRDFAYVLFFAVTEHTEREAREIAFFSDVCGGGTEVNVSASFLNGLRAYAPFSEVSDLTEMDSEQHELASALVRLGATAYYLGANAESFGEGVLDTRRQLFLSDPSLVDLVADNVDRIDEITAFVKERKNLDADLILTYLNDGTVLREGQL